MRNAWKNIKKPCDCSPSIDPTINPQKTNRKVFYPQPFSRKNRVKMKRVWFLVLPSIIVVNAAFCQRPLSLLDAIDAGLNNNYDIRIERGNVEVTKNNNNSGEAGRWPTITFDANQNNGVTDNIKTANPFALQGQIVSSSIVPAININWVLFDGFRVNVTERRLEQLQAESEGNASIVIANTLQAIILGYYLAVLEQSRLEEYRKQLALSRDRYTYTLVKSSIGSAVTTDVLLEEGNYLTDSVNYINQELAFRNAQRDLKVLMGDRNGEAFQLIDTLTFTDELYRYDDLEQRMLDSNPDIKKQFITQALLRNSTRSARADRLPTIQFNSGYSKNLGLTNLSRTSLGESQRDSLAVNPDAQFDVNYQNSLSAITDNYYANFTLSFTLFNGGKINRAIKNTIVEEQIGGLQLEELETSLQRDLQAALDSYNVRRTLYRINERREEAAGINLKLSEEKFKNGTINSFDYREVQNNYLSASILKLDALYNLMDAKVALMRLTGGLISEYAQ